MTPERRTASRNRCRWSTRSGEKGGSMIRNRRREDAEVDEAQRKLVPRLVVAVLALVVGLTGAVSASPGSGASGGVLAQGRMPGRLKIKTRDASDVVVQQGALQPGG